MDCYKSTHTYTHTHTHTHKKDKNDEKKKLWRNLDRLVQKGKICSFVMTFKISFLIRFI